MSKWPCYRLDTFSGCVEEGGLTLESVSVVDVYPTLHQQFHSLQTSVPTRVVKRSLPVLVRIVKRRTQLFSQLDRTPLTVSSQVKYQVLLQIVLVLYVHTLIILYFNKLIIHFYLDSQIYFIYHDHTKATTFRHTFPDFQFRKCKMNLF